MIFELWCSEKRVFLRFSWNCTCYGLFYSTLTPLTFYKCINLHCKYAHLSYIWIAVLKMRVRFAQNPTTCNKRSCRMQISALSHQTMPEVIDLYWITSFGSGHNLVYHHQSFNLMLNDFCWRSRLPSVWVPNIAKSNLATYNYSYQFLFFIPRILYS